MPVYNETMNPETTVDELLVASLEAPALTAADRCDSCGAQAYVLATLPTGSSLLFCGHHWTKHEEKISVHAPKIQDERHKLRR